MLKEIKYLIFIAVIALFIFLTGRYYFSDENKKKSYRSYKNNDEKIKLYSKNLPVLENDTKNVMLKEIKYLIFIIIIVLFIFLTGKYYFSDDNKKKSYRSYKTNDDKIKLYSKDLPILKNNTINAVEYVKQTNKKKKKKFNFWKLLEND